MSLFAPLRRSLLGPRLEVWYHPDYRLPLAGLELIRGLDQRRSDFVAWYLSRLRGVRLHTPGPISYAKLAHVHGSAYLESLQEAETLAGIFAVEPDELSVDRLLRSLRLACGGTFAAARLALELGRPCLNLFGGFHHAGPNRGGGFCAVNDLAVALAALRRGGFSGRAVVLDLDAHPPDGTAECLRADPDAWVGSISGSDWGALPGVDETVLPPGSRDAAYREALEGLLNRMPRRPDLAFVIAGGDVLEHDLLGTLALTEQGARQRDLRVARALKGVPSVWLPGGGYQDGAWRVLAGTALVLAGSPGRTLPRNEDPLRRHYQQVGRSLEPSQLSDSPSLITQEELDEALGQRPSGRRLMGYYTSEGLHYALQRYGFLDQVRRLGYSRFDIQLERLETGDRFCLYGHAHGERHLLVDCVLTRRILLDRPVLFIQWLTLSHPRAHFSPQRPRLPGQQTPGLGLAREVTELLAQLARRLGLAGVALHPAWYHVAFAARHQLAFLDDARQGRFEALVRDLAGIPLVQATRAVAEGRLHMNGVAYRWEADDMVTWLGHPPARERGAIAAERDRVHFALTAEPALSDPRPGP